MNAVCCLLSAPTDLRIEPILSFRSPCSPLSRVALTSQLSGAYHSFPSQLHAPARRQLVLFLPPPSRSSRSSVANRHVAGWPPLRRGAQLLNPPSRVNCTPGAPHHARWLSLSALPLPPRPHPPLLCPALRFSSSLLLPVVRCVTVPSCCCC